jgi:hypothetical protein
MARLTKPKHVQYDVMSLPRLLHGFSLECSVVTQQMALAVVIVLISYILQSLLGIHFHGLGLSSDV